MNMIAKLDTDVTADGPDYDIVRQVIELISEEYRDQPSLEAIAARLHQSPTQLQKTFTRWAGLSPKAFLQAVTLDHAKRLLRREEMPLLETSIEVGLSGPSRLHDLFVTHEAMSPGEWKAKGGGLTIRYGFHTCPFGTALVMVTDRGLAGLAFSDSGDEKACLEDMTCRWPNADYVEDRQATAPYAERIFQPGRWTSDQPLRVVLIGTDFQVSVWQSLLKVPFGKAVTYSDIAKDIGRPTAMRAVGAAVGANPISFVVPCHRALGKNGALTGYHWGLTRKRAMLGWESAHA
ncbi:bifunctional helix-turn-helix domain-containing protein/methylated-DNA--[protein]-cysteine S-methyltransferase [Rhizobium sp. WYJ-E13]|uniref:methylated-DNA--[protein]-cysteine S-methyltransferase n=1 Tax=Rhizobium sp. WYJ-E13 TaxID=2849093 RepID=UPI001C1EAE4D|nr:bifunctional helix-turn-helix domain-containing protein/methylated-DNA--[protein]-cysteine S-methyltransferase [Rhizobium sp. WYJ-E13]QWW67329.1 bifunctional helix-turn-helix domain-containing protein/methylated-DNA--[protein]-cysteine S-methyltransferase [Rhizobium sp. WYJ-E13]